MDNHTHAHFIHNTCICLSQPLVITKTPWCKWILQSGWLELLWWGAADRMQNENVRNKNERGLVLVYSLFASRPAFAGITTFLWCCGVCCFCCSSCFFMSWMSGDISDMGVPNTSSHASCISWSNISDDIWSSVNISTLKQQNSTPKECAQIQTHLWPCYSWQTHNWSKQCAFV